MRTRNVIVGLLGLGVVAAVVWVAVVAVPRLTGELGEPPPSNERLPALPTVVASSLQWESGPGMVGSWLTAAAVFGSDGFIYALSTAPGLREIPNGVPVPHAVYRSEDGLVWSNELVAGLGEDLYPRDIAHDGSSLYLVGTVPSARNPNTAAVRLGSSLDGGRSWDSVDLDLVDNVAAQNGEIARGGLHVDVAASSIGTMVGTGQTRWINDAGESLVTVFVGSGLDDVLPVATPFAASGLERVEATSDSFYAIVRPDGGFREDMTLLELWRSPDGIQWERSENFPFLDSVSAFGEVGDYRVVVGQIQGSLVVGASMDDVVWDEIDLSDLVPQVGAGGQWVSAAGIGSAGLYFNLQSFIPVPGREESHDVSQLIESADLRSWSSIATASLMHGYVEQVVVGDDFVFVNGISGVPGTRVHLIGTRE